MGTGSLSGLEVKVACFCDFSNLPILHGIRMNSRRLFLPRQASFVWNLSYVVLSLFQRLFYHIQVEGLQNVPAQGPVVLASNHTSGHDIIILGCTSPRQIFFMAKKELFEKHWLIATYFHWAGVFPVDRGGNDRKAVALAISHLRQGRVLGMFPEGKRFTALAEGKTGVARLALKTNAAIVPVAIVGAHQISISQRLKRWHRTRVSIRYGEPLTVALNADMDNYEKAQAVTSELMRTIARMLPAEMRGVYADV